MNASARRVAAVLHRHHGLAPLQRFLEAGCTRREVAFHRAEGRLIRPRVGWYLSPAAPDAAVRAVRIGGVLGCLSAAEALGLAMPEDRQGGLEVSLPSHATRQRHSERPDHRVYAGDEAGVRWHWEERLRPPRGYVVHPLDALLQMAACASARWLTVAVDSAIHGGRDAPPLLPLAQLRELRSALPERLRSAVDLADPAAESVGETLARLGLREAGIPCRLQVPIAGKYRGDLLIEDWLVFEVDGRAHHSGEEAFVADRERDSLMAWYGYRVLRFTHHQVLHEWPFVLDVVQRVLAGGRPTPLRR